MRKQLYTPVPNLRRAEWLDRLVRRAEKALDPRQRRRIAKRAGLWLLGLLAAALARQAWNVTSARLGWTPPPARSGEVMAPDRAPPRPLEPRRTLPRW